MKAGRLLATSLLMAVALSEKALLFSQAAQALHPPIPWYSVSFQKAKPIEGLRAAPMFRIPFVCASDGTAFISLFDPAPLLDQRNTSGQYLAAIPLSGEPKIIRISALTELQSVHEIEYYATDSKVAFLVQAREAGSSKDQELHFYAVIFDRDGQNHKVVRLDDAFHVNALGMFESGSFLAYGWDEVTHAPRLALLKDDGAILKYLQPEEGALPESPMNKGPKGNGPPLYISPTQFVSLERSIILVQNRSDSPLVEVSEGGAMRVIRPKLPRGETINMLVPSDSSLFARVGKLEDGLIYEIDPENGNVVKQIEVRQKQPGANVACVHEGKFVSIEADLSRSDGALLSLIGMLEPIAAPVTHSH